MPTDLALDDSLIEEASRKILAALARGEQEIAEGMGYELDEVLAEADQLLARSDL
jgi:predicted transcriptional regulator